MVHDVYGQVPILLEKRCRGLDGNIWGFNESKQYAASGGTHTGGGYALGVDGDRSRQSNLRPSLSRPSHAKDRFQVYPLTHSGLTLRFS